MITPARDDAVLVASELAANATAHSSSGTPGGMFLVRVADITDEHITILVTDQGGPTIPTVRTAQRDAESGRGLQVVEAMTSMCVTLDDHRGLRTVFAVIPVPAPEPATPNQDHQDTITRNRARTLGPIIPDVAGQELCPDPLTAATAEELQAVLRQFWIWSGRPSYRSMARHIGRRYSPSTLHSALNATSPPSFDKLLAIVEGCSGTTTHQQAFATAWRKLHMRRDGLRK